MRLFFIFLILYVIAVNANEVQRIESITDEISQLRKEYTKVKSSLVEMEVMLEEEKAKTKKQLKKEENYKNKIVNLENQIKSIKKLSKTKVKKEKVCKKQEIKIIKNIIKIEKPLKNQVKNDTNKFPTLLMKKANNTPEIDKHPFAYRVKVEANIYDGIEGKMIDSWESMTSFTSNRRTKEWIKITGYFVNKTWKASQKEMWIKSSDALKREK